MLRRIAVTTALAGAAVLAPAAASAAPQGTTFNVALANKTGTRWANTLTSHQITINTGSYLTVTNWFTGECVDKDGYPGCHNLYKWTAYSKRDCITRTSDGEVKLLNGTCTQGNRDEHWAFMQDTTGNYRLWNQGGDCWVLTHGSDPGLNVWCDKSVDEGDWYHWTP